MARKPRIGATDLTVVAGMITALGSPIGPISIGARFQWRERDHPPVTGAAWLEAELENDTAEQVNEHLAIAIVANDGPPLVTT